MNLDEIIMSLVDRDGAEADADTIATEAMSKVGIPDDIAVSCFTVVRHHAQHRIKERRRANAPVWTKPDKPSSAPTEATEAKNVNAVARPAWINERFSLADGRFVTWADATVEQHEQRIAFQLKLASGIKRDIDNHNEAIRRIKAAGVTCLADLPEYGGTGKAVS